MRLMLFGLLLFAGAAPLRAQDGEATLYVTVLERRSGYVVGAANAASGLHRYEADSTWTHLGWRNVRNFGVDAPPGQQQVLYLACGNGGFRSTDGGRTWRITTGWQLTEALDVAVDPNAPDHVYLATAYGVWRSTDGADTWEKASQGIPAPQSTFTQALAADRTRQGHLVVGSEGGLFRTTDGATTWVPVGPRDVAVRDVQQSAAQPDLWLAGTEDHGVLRSRDGGETWAFLEGGVEQETVYAVASDPFDADRMAVAGFHTGVFFSDDGGARWTQRTEGLPELNIHALVFDPARPGRLWVGTYGGGVFYSDDGGRQWTPAGLRGAVIYDMDFIGGK